MTGDDIRTFHEEGYLAVRAATDAQGLVRVRTVAAALIAARAGAERGDHLDLIGNDRAGPARVPQILMPTRYAAELGDHPLRRDAWRIARALLGDAAAYQGEHIIAKPSSPASEVPLHQDEAFWGEATEYHSITVWFPLQDTDARNGCLRVVPRSHRLDVIAHRSIGGDPTNNGLEIVAPERFAAVCVPLRCGDASVHHCRTIHGSGANRSGGDRYAYVFGFGLPVRPRSEPRTFPWLRDRKLLRETLARQAGRELTRMRPEL